MPAWFSISRLALALSVFLSASSALAQGKPGDTLNVAVTIAPIHSLTAAIMEGAGAPTLLLKGGASAHSYAMKPSDAKILQNAQIVIQVDETYEAFLQKALKTLPKKARIITLAEIDGLTLWPVREGGEYEEHAHEGGHQGHSHGEKHSHGQKHAHAKHDHAKRDAKSGGGHEEHGGNDVHVWFDPQNAAIMAAHIADALSEAAPQHAALFKANAASLKDKLNALDAELKAILEPVQGKPFIVFHDVVQYFEKRYGLASAGAITLSPERQPSAKRLAEMREKIKRLDAACVFSEPQFSPKLVDTLISGVAAKKGVLDEIGVGLKPGPDLYFEFMRLNARNLRDCLAS